jgi:hypothetical protein
MNEREFHDEDNVLLQILENQVPFQKHSTDQTRKNGERQFRRNFQTFQIEEFGRWSIET